VAILYTETEILMVSVYSTYSTSSGIDESHNYCTEHYTNTHVIVGPQF